MISTNSHVDFTDQNFFIGIDVHKKNWTVTLRHNQMELKTFSMNPSPQALQHYMLRHYPGAHCQSTYEAGFSGFWIHRELEQFGFTNMVIHPGDIPTTHKEKTTKTDKVDSRKLARELENGTLRGIYIPGEFHQQLRSLCRLRYRQLQNLVRVKNRIKGHLYTYGISIPSHDELPHWSGRFIQWLKSLRFSFAPGNEYVRLCLEELEDHKKRLAQTIRLLRTYCKEHGITDKIRFLCSVPGIGFVTAITLYTELIDIHRFSGLDSFASYVGLIPSLHSSGERESQCGLTHRHNRYLRYILVEAAWVAIRKDPVLLCTFNRLTRRMKKQDAIIRIAKKLLSRIAYVWKNETPYVCPQKA